MNGIYGNLVLNGFHDHSFDIGFALKLFDSAENNGMVRNNNICTNFNGFVYHRFGTI